MADGDLDSVAEHVRAFYRLCGMVSDDNALTKQGDAVDEVAYQFLTIGSRNAQHWMLDNGYVGWRARSSALTFSGTDAADGGRYASLPTDFLRAFAPRGHKLPGRIRSALVKANGDPWGEEIFPTDNIMKGDGYFLRDEQIWLTRNANPPATLYLEYIHAHPAWASGTTIDFPLRARSLIAAEAAAAAADDSWLPAEQRMQHIERRLGRARMEARQYARQSTRPGEFRRATRFGNRWGLIPFLLLTLGG